MALMIYKGDHPNVVIGDGDDGVVHIFNQFGSAWCAEEDPALYEDGDAPSLDGEAEVERQLDPEAWCSNCLDQGRDEGIVKTV